jgi:hypothetical protein
MSYSPMSYDPRRKSSKAKISMLVAGVVLAVVGVVVSRMAYKPYTPAEMQQMKNPNMVLWWKSTGGKVVVWIIWILAILSIAHYLWGDKLKRLW